MTLLKLLLSRDVIWKIICKHFQTPPAVEVTLATMEDVHNVAGCH